MQTLLLTSERTALGRLRQADISVTAKAPVQLKSEKRK
jgi:hypothetical protein